MRRPVFFIASASFLQKQVAIAKLDEAKAAVYQEAVTEMNRIATLNAAEAEWEYQKSMGNVSDAAYNEATALLANLKAKNLSAEQNALLDSVMDNANKRAALLDNQLSAITTGTYDFAKASKVAQDSFSDMVDWFERRINVLDKSSICDK